MDYALTVDAAWRKIRARRHLPPGNAVKDYRRLVFAAAMKQSEQFFRLADQAGYETKPVMLYYGLNQAARGIVAVAAPPDEPWELSGHGLSCPGLNQATTLGDIVVVDNGKTSSFQRLAYWVESPTLLNRVEFRELWASLPEGAEVSLQGSDKLCTAVRLEIRIKEPSVGTGRRYQSDITGIRLRGLPYGDNAPSYIAGLLKQRYPSLGRLMAVEREGIVSTLISLPDPRGSIGMETRDSQDHVDVYQLMQYGPDIYRDHKHLAVNIIPTLAGNAKPMAPIVTWWAVLYTLSMMARYQPATWTKTLDIDSSPDAPAVEYLLDEAHRACVNLIVDSLKTVEQTAFWQDEQD